MTPLTTVYATSEDVAVRAAGDFLKLVPKDQVLASGTDGTLSASDPWVLTSVAVDFFGNGVRPGDVVALSGTRSTPAAAKFGQENDPTLFAVDAVTGHALTLRRKGMPAGVGQPPGDIDLAGVRFEVLTLFPQIERASYQEINERYAIDPSLSWRAPGDLYDARQLRDVTVLAVLEALYADQARQGDDVYAKKAMMAHGKLDSEISRMSLRWQAALSGDQPTSSPFSMRMVR